MNLQTEIIRFGCPDKKWEQLESFAESFGHKVPHQLSYIVLKDGENWLGYMAIVPRVIIPAIKPDAVDKKSDIVKLIDYMIGHSMIEYGECWVGLSEDSFAIKNFEKQGAVDQGLKLFRKG